MAGTLGPHPDGDPSRRLSATMIMEVLVDIELADAVTGVREELLEAARRGVGQDIGFVVGSIEMQFTVELRADAKARAGFKAWVVSGEAEAGVSRVRTHRVTVSLTPKQRDGGDLLIAADVTGLVGPGDTLGHQGR